MNKKLITAGAALSASSYVSPETKVKEIHSEGVLCMSFMQQQTLSIQKWEVDEDFSW